MNVLASILQSTDKLQSMNKTAKPAPAPTEPARITQTLMTPTRPFITDDELDPLEEKVLDACDAIGIGPKHTKAILALALHSKERDNLHLEDVDRVLKSLRRSK